MGTHPNGPAVIETTGVPLLDYLKSNPNAVGMVPERYSSDQLPFIFKVLSVRTALSIQVCLTRVHFRVVNVDIAVSSRYCACRNSPLHSARIL